MRRDNTDVPSGMEAMIDYRGVGARDGEYYVKEYRTAATPRRKP